MDLFTVYFAQADIRSVFEPKSVCLLYKYKLCLNIYFDHFQKMKRIYFT
jgi:hypothetical protein